MLLLLISHVVVIDELCCSVRDDEHSSSLFLAWFILNFIFLKSLNITEHAEFLDLRCVYQLCRAHYTLRKKCWNDVDFPHVLTFGIFHHDLMWGIPLIFDVVAFKILITKSSIRWKMHIEIKLLLLCGISSACRLRWQVHIITMISLVECSV